MTRILMVSVLAWTALSIAGSASASPIAISASGQSSLWQLDASDWDYDGRYVSVGRAETPDGPQCLIRWKKGDQFVYLSRTRDGGIKWMEVRPNTAAAPPITIPAEFVIDGRVFETEISYFYRPRSKGVAMPFGQMGAREAVGGIQMEFPAEFLRAFSLGENARVKTRLGAGEPFPLTRSMTGVVGFRTCEAELGS